MYVIVAVWVVAIVVGVLLFMRFTRPPTMPTVVVPGQRIVPRRVYPLWLVLVLFIILVIALWVTLRHGALYVGPGRSADAPGVMAGPRRG